MLISDQDKKVEDIDAEVESLEREVRALKDGLDDLGLGENVEERGLDLDALSDAEIDEMLDSLGKDR